MRIAGFIATLLLICGGTARAADQSTDASVRDCNATIENSRAAARSKNFSDQAPSIRWQIFADLVNCALELQRWEEALNGINALLEIEPDNTGVLALKMIVTTIEPRDLPGGVASLERIAETAPEDVSNIELEQLLNMFRRLKEHGDPDLRFRFYKAVFSSDYAPPNAVDTADGLRIGYIRDLLEKRSKSYAVEQIRKIADPLIVAEFLFDKRYDDLARFPAMPKSSDLARLVEDEITLSKRLLAEHPDEMKAHIRYAQALRTNGRFDDALMQTTKTVALLYADDAEERFSDYGDQARWVYNEHAYALYDVGRNAEAREALEAGARLNEFGGANASQTINLATMLFREGLFAEAEKTIGGLERKDASPFGWMWAAAVKICVRSLNGAKPHPVDLEFARANQAENDSAYAEILLCLGDEDAAAAHFIARLGDPERRAAALRSVQKTLEANYNLPIGEKLERRQAAVAARPDVAAEINKVGRIIDLPFFPIYWGDY